MIRIDLLVFIKRGETITVQGLPSPAGTAFASRAPTAGELNLLAEAMASGKIWA